jgi:hypothetical protein
MAPTARIGVIRIEIDGDWDIGDLLALPESLAESYGLFYPLVAAEDIVRDALYDQLRQIFWSGDIESRYIGRRLYRQIPSGESLKLRSFSYASAGVMENGGVLACLLMLAKIARAWIQASGDLIDLWEKIDKFFAKRKDLRKPKGKIVLDDDMAVSSDEARSLCFAVGEKLGFDAISCDTLINIVGNPIAALKYLVAAGAEGRKLAKLQQERLLKLPEPTGETIVIPTAKKRSRSTASGVIVEKRRRRPNKPKK